MKKRIYIAYTGGTIGMKPTGDGYAPSPGYLAERMASMPELQSADLPEYTIHEYQPLIDSSDMTPDNWLAIARDIAGHYGDYDGFIVLHGTDTMAYTASALPFMLKGLRKPVIVTGSQIPLCEIRNDARDNLITSLIIASRFAIPEVCLFFGNRLLRGCRSVKVDADEFDAFDSPNFPPLGTAGIDIDIHWERVRKPQGQAPDLEIRKFGDPMVAVLRLFPGIRADILSNILRPPLKGLVLEAYGVGNGPQHDKTFIAALKEASCRGIVVVVCTQCLKGAVHLGDYVAGSALAQAGAISGFDMTAEAALAKLFYLFGTGRSPEQVRKEMQKDLRGEITLP